MNKIINFPNKNIVKFVVKATNIEIYKDKYNQPIKKKHAIISIQNIENKKEAIHPITDFIFTYWKQKEYNYMANVAHKTVSFLNWIFFDSNNTINDLSKLETYHAIDFLYSLTGKGNSQETVKSYEKVLVKFFKYLISKEILDKNLNIENIKTEIENNIVYNNRPKDNKIHEFKSELIIPFIELAFKEENCIALGLYYQIFAGLRAGEVVNIATTDIKNIGAYGEFGQILNLEPKDFRDDINTTSGKGEIKVNRKQVVFPYKSLLKKLYKHHTNTYKSTDGSDALFVDRNGNAMTGDSYNYHFKKLKEKFIKNLEISEDIRLQTYANHLKTMKWGTHIGRGLYSNLMAEYTDNPLELAVARGDKSSYIENIELITKNIQDNLELLYNNNLLKRIFIDSYIENKEND